LNRATYFCSTPSSEYPFPSFELPLIFKTYFMKMFSDISERTGALIFFGALITLLVVLYKLTM
jgi:hypothetical protein